MSRSKAKGMTLLEIMIAVGIASAVMAMAVSVVGAGVTLARKGEQTVASNEASRAGMEMLLRDLRIAGTGGGLFVTDSAGTPVQINSIFTQAGTNGTDELWLVVPRSNMMQNDCSKVGSAAIVSASGTGPLTVNCTAPLAGATTLLVTNFSQGALISGLTLATGTSITYAESGVSGFSNNPQTGGFQRGDYVVPVDVVHYFVRLNAVTNRPELIRSPGALNTPVSAAAPFKDVSTNRQDRFPDIEDLQVAFGSGVAPSLTFASGHTVVYNPAAAPVALRLTVVGITPRPVLDDQNKVQPFGPVDVEDHLVSVPPPDPDGYRRSVYRRRIELLNMGPANL